MGLLSSAALGEKGGMLAEGVESFLVGSVPPSLQPSKEHSCALEQLTRRLPPQREPYCYPL